MARSATSIAKDRERNRAWFATHPNYKKEWREANPDKVEAHNKKSNNKRRGARSEYFKLVWNRDKEKDKARWRQRNYGVTPEQFSALRSTHNDCCAICKGKFEDESKIQIDHCHKTGAVRGLLCGSCNRGLGCFGDDVDRIRQAMRYLTCDDKLAGG